MQSGMEAVPAVNVVKIEVHPHQFWACQQSCRSPFFYPELHQNSVTLHLSSEFWCNVTVVNLPGLFSRE